MRQETLNHLGQEVRGRAAGRGHFFDQLASELLYLSSSSLLFDVANSMTGPDSMLPASARQRLERDYAAVARTYPYVYQVRFVDAKGQEVVRVDRRGERLVTVPQHELQDKSDRYYFKEGMARESSQVYVSALDLTVEHGKAELPERPVVRFATPIGQSRRVLSSVGTSGLRLLSLSRVKISLAKPQPRTKSLWCRWESRAHARYVGRRNANQTGSEWQFKTNVALSHELLGRAVLDILKDNRLVGIEFVDEISD